MTDRDNLLLEIKSYFAKMVVEKHLFKNQECLSLAIELIDDLAILAPELLINNVFETEINFSNVSEAKLITILNRLKIFDSEMQKYRKLH